MRNKSYCVAQMYLTGNPENETDIDYIIKDGFSTYQLAEKFLQEFLTNEARWELKIFGSIEKPTIFELDPD